MNKHFITDGQHYIIDIKLDETDDLYDLAKTLNSMPGIVEYGFRDFILLDKTTEMNI